MSDFKWLLCFMLLLAILAKANMIDGVDNKSERWHAPEDVKCPNSWKDTIDCVGSGGLYTCVRKENEDMIDIWCGRKIVP